MPMEFEIRGDLAKAKKALILLHGRGATAHDIMGLADVFCDDQFYVAAPQAPDHAWYPHSFIEEESQNEPYLSNSIASVKRLIDKIAKHIDKSQIYLMGFSQGASLSLEVAARFADKYGGVVGFSGGLIGSKISEKKYHGDFAGTKVFIGISEEDPYVPLTRCKESKQVMERLGGDVTLNVYKGAAHTINDDEIHWVKKNIFAQKTL